MEVNTPSQSTRPHPAIFTVHEALDVCVLHNASRVGNRDYFSVFHTSNAPAMGSHHYSSCLLSGHRFDDALAQPRSHSISNPRSGFEPEHATAAASSPKFSFAILERETNGIISQTIRG